MPRRRRASGGLARWAVLGVALTSLLFGACSQGNDWSREECLKRTGEVVSAVPESSDPDAQAEYAKKLQDLNAELVAHKCLGTADVPSTVDPTTVESTTVDPTTTVP